MWAQFCEFHRFTFLKVRELGLAKFSLKAVYPNVAFWGWVNFWVLASPRPVVGGVLTAAQLRFEWAQGRLLHNFRGWSGHLSAHMLPHYCPHYWCLICMCIRGSNHYAQSLTHFDLDYPDFDIGDFAWSNFYVVRI